MSAPHNPQVQAPEARLSLLVPLNALIRHLRLLAACVVVATVLGGIFGYLTKEFVASSALMPQSSASAASRLAGVAAQFGLAVGGSDDGESIAFYAAFLKSRALLTDLAHTTFTFPKYVGSSDTVSGNLITLLKLEQDTPTATDRAAFLELQDRVTASADFTSGLLTTTVQMPNPILAEQVNRRMLELLNEFNLTRRQSNSRAEREFSESRLADAITVLRENEQAMQRFLTENRTYQGAPRLEFEHTRLQRTIDAQQSVVTALRQSVEQARLDEVRDVPVVTVVDPPEGGGRSSRNPIIFAIMMGFVGGVMGLGAVLVLEYLDLEKREDPAKIEGFRQAVREQLAWRPWRRRS